MGLYAIKLLLSAAIIVAVTEVAKVNTSLGALIKSLPLVSLISLIWIYVETQDAQKISALSSSTFWLVLPTLPMFLVLPALLKQGLGFYSALGMSVLVMLGCYGLTVFLLKGAGVEL